MKRIIPKQSKVNTIFFKDLLIRDIVFATISLLLVAVIGFSNIPFNFIIAMIVLAVACLLFFVKVEERLYYELYVLLRYLFSKKKFNGAEQTAVEDIEEDLIKFKGGYYAGVLKIEPMEFFLLREEVQDRLISAFSVIYKNLSLGQKISLVKLDRPIFLDGFVQELKDRIDLNVEETERSKILKIRKEELEKINTNTNCCYYNAFYVVVYGTKSQILTSTTQDIREMANSGIMAKRIGGDELKGFIKRTITQVFDEREVAEKKDLKQYITPKKINFKRKYVEVDGVNEYTVVVNRYPVETFNAWATALCNIDYTKVVINATPIALEKAVRQLDRTAAEIEERYNKTGRISKQAESETHYASLKYLVEELGNNNEVMLDVSIAITGYDYDNKGGEFRRELRKTINKLGFRTSAMVCRQAEAYRISTLNNSMAHGQVYAQGINSSSLASAFPFVSNQILEEKGVFLGENSAPVIIDFFKRDDFHKNSNIVVLGSVGGGKSFFAKTLFVNLLSDNVRLFVLDPEAEYGILANNMGGEIIDMGAGGNIINPFAVLTDVSDDADSSNLLLSHLTFLEEFFRTTLEGLEPENLELVLSLLPKLYARMGITPQVDLKKYQGDYPTFDDFAGFIAELEKKSTSSEEKDKYSTIGMFIAKFATNGRYSFLWNGQTNLKANEDFIVFNFQTLLANANKTIASAQMLLLTQYLNNELIHNYNKIKSGDNVKPIVIAIDEAHVFIDPTNPVALRFMKNTAKRCRKYQGMQVVLTQSVNDFLGASELERESKAVITESQYTFVFPLNASSAADFLRLYDKLDITNEESNAIMDNPRGTTFFIAHQRNRTSFRVIAPDKIREMFEKKK